MTQRKPKKKLSINDRIVLDNLSKEIGVNDELLDPGYINPRSILRALSGDFRLDKYAEDFLDTIDDDIIHDF